MTGCCREREHEEEGMNVKMHILAINSVENPDFMEKKSLYRIFFWGYLYIISFFSFLLELLTKI